MRILQEINVLQNFNIYFIEYINEFYVLLNII